MGDTDWLDGGGAEPQWPEHRAHTHKCPGCGLDRPADCFEAVDTWIGGRWGLLVRCDECRLVRPFSEPFDDKSK